MAAECIPANSTQEQYRVTLHILSTKGCGYCTLLYDRLKKSNRLKESLDGIYRINKLMIDQNIDYYRALFGEDKIKSVPSIVFQIDGLGSSIVSQVPKWMNAAGNIEDIWAEILHVYENTFHYHIPIENRGALTPDLRSAGFAISPTPQFVPSPTSTPRFL